MAEYKIGFQVPPELDLDKHVDSYEQALKSLLLSEAVHGYREPYINKRTKVIPIEAINKLFEEAE